MAFEELAENLGLENDEFMELVELFIDTAQSDIEKIQAARDNMDAPQAGDAAHSLKGSAGNLGFMELSDIAKDLEENARSGSLEGFDAKINKLTEKLEEISNQLNS